MTQTINETANTTSLVQSMIQKAKIANKELEKFTQEKIDAIVRELALVVYNNAEPLAKMAVEETRMGSFQDKILKNKAKSELIYDHLKKIKTVGILNDDKERGVVEIAEPVGIVAALIPCTNPSVTAMSNSMFAIKGRNSIILAPHPRSKATTVETTRMMIEAAKKVGLPENAIQIIEEPSKESSQELMTTVDFILATGGPGMVKAAYSSGKPSYGVGAGNVPVAIHGSADIPQAVSDIIRGKKFDNGLICSSEQTVIVTEDIAAKVLDEFKKQNTYVLNAAEKSSLKKVMYPEADHVSADIVGQSSNQIAKMAGINLPADNNGVIMVQIEEIGKNEPFSGEKMSPVLAFYVVKSFEDVIQSAKSVLEYQGIGHTADIHIDKVNQDIIMKYALTVKASRVLVNQPSSTSAGGSRQNGLVPTTTLGCGSWGNNTSSDNITAKHLINIKRLAYKLDTTRNTANTFNEK